MGCCGSRGKVEKAAAPETKRGAFVSAWCTGESCEVTIPLTGMGQYDFEVEWGDGQADHITSYNQPEVTHKFASPGTYLLSITGVIEGFCCKQTDASKKIDRGYSPVGRAPIGGYFEGCSNMAMSAHDSPDLSGTDNLSSMFRGASALDGDVSAWDVSKVTSMSQMFSAASVLGMFLLSLTWGVCSGGHLLSMVT